MIITIQVPAIILNLYTNQIAKNLLIGRVHHKIKLIRVLTIRIQEVRVTNRFLALKVKE